MEHSNVAGEPAITAPGVSQAFVARAIYGLITVLAVLQLMAVHPPSAWSAAVSLFGTTLAVALVDAYADSVAEMLSHGRNLSLGELREIWRDVGPVLVGAITLAQVAAFLFLFGYGWRTGQLLHESWFRQLISGLILVAIGGFIVGIKAAFH